MVDPRLVLEIARNMRGCNYVVEPGAGLGVVTSRLSDNAGYVLGVEVDARFIPLLGEVAREHKNIDVVYGDILELFFERVECMAGNLPYSITGPFFSRLVKVFRPKSAIFTVQREVASRLAAKPGTSSYGRLTVLVQLVYEVKLGNVYPPSSFYPPPEVYSQTVNLRLREDAVSPSEIEIVEEFTRCLFSQRNKRVAKVLRSCCENGDFVNDVGERRVYELSPSEVYSLALKCFGSSR
ncbi:ribosomal RNA adenine methylase transferase [Pyrolobus fumarii 1A]|uniref:Ribosomal RNA adenine methylase transferase n=1 Tax=Pyrolobus fumarii (strain DSM 11204 / 1A) TaxID=694429 RepID=G0EES8_PYRF1|nr:ribosomal RNA adenine methylase transferase [Pyrolobus fumarii 1A]